MKNHFFKKLRLGSILLIIGLSGPPIRLSAQATLHHYLYVAAPGVRNYLEFGRSIRNVCPLDFSRGDFFYWGCGDLSWRVDLVGPNRLVVRQGGPYILRFRR